MGLHKNTRDKLPLVAFLYYRDACCQEEVSRRTGLAVPTVSKLISTGAAKAWLDHAERNDGEWVGKDQPFRSLQTPSGTTRGRFIKRHVHP